MGKNGCSTYDKDRKQVEFGIEPDYFVSLTDDDFRQGKDTLIEFARKLLAEWEIIRIFAHVLGLTAL